jgi:hypothetical protein
MREEPGKRDEILPVMFDKGDERAAVAGAHIGLIELRYHLPGDIIVPCDPKNLLLESGQPEGRETVLPSPPAEREEIEMRNPGLRRDSVIGEAIRYVRKIEGSAVIGYESRVRL